MYGLIGKVRAVTGHRDALAAILLEGTRAMSGCLSYVVATDPADPDALWITEVGESSESPGIDRVARGTSGHRRRAGAIWQDSVIVSRTRFDFVIRSGRALVVPAYKGVYDRQGSVESTWPDPSHRFVEYATAWIEDLRRTIDYLETREDFDVARLPRKARSQPEPLAPAKDLAVGEPPPAFWTSAGGVCFGGAALWSWVFRRDPDV